MDKEEEPDKQLQADRDVPSVAVTSQTPRILMGAFLCLALVGMIYIIASDANKDKKQPLVTHEDVTFKSRGKSAEPYIRPDPVEKPAQVATGKDDEALRREQMMQNMALRMAEEQQKKMQKRLQSPQIVFDQSSAAPASQASTSNAPQGGTGGFGAGGDMNDPNVAFAAQAAGQGYETSRASRMQNIDTLIAQGTMIAGILETAIQSDLPGMVRAQVSEDIYSFDGSTLVIPKGAKLVGQYRSGLVRGQSRVFVIWNRLIRNDGVTVNIGSIGTDDLGRSGLDGRVDTHFFERFGSSVLLSMIDTSLQIVANNSRNQNSATVALETGNDFSRAAEIALENSVAIPPTVHVDQGKRIKVFVSKDLDFSQVMAQTADAGSL